MGWWAGIVVCVSACRSSFLRGGGPGTYPFELGLKGNPFIKVDDSFFGSGRAILTLENEGTRGVCLCVFVRACDVIATKHAACPWAS